MGYKFEMTSQQKTSPQLSFSPRISDEITSKCLLEVVYSPHNHKSMELIAKLVQLLPLQTGQGKNGPWKKQDIILETDGTYPKKVCVSIWGDKIDAGQLQVGNKLKVQFDVESREYNGRWYTDVKAWKVEMADGSSSGPIDSEPDFVADGGNDLPF